MEAGKGRHGKGPGEWPPKAACEGARREQGSGVCTQGNPEGRGGRDTRGQSTGPPFRHTSQSVKCGDDPGSRAETYGPGCSITSSEAWHRRGAQEAFTERMGARPGRGTAASVRGSHDAELRASK